MWRNRNISGRFYVGNGWGFEDSAGRSVATERDKLGESESDEVGGAVGDDDRLAVEGDR